MAETTGDRRPHRMPPLSDVEGDIAAWKCEACGEWVGDGYYIRRDPGPCRGEST